MSAAAVVSTASRWDASLELDFALLERRSSLVRRRHSGPLVVQKTLHPEGERVCHAILLHPPGGVAGGDRLHLRVGIEAGAHALLTTPGAGKWYKANGSDAAQTVSILVEDGALFEQLPQETIVYNAARADWRTRIELGGGAVYAGWDVTCLGRRAAGERFFEGLLRQRVQIVRDGRLLWSEHVRLRGGDALLQSVAGLRGCCMTATFLVAAGDVPPAILDACRSMPAPPGCHAGVTAPPGLFVARCLGDHARDARAWFEAMWAILRPWYAGIAAQRPRIWNT